MINDFLHRFRAKAVVVAASAVLAASSTQVTAATFDFEDIADGGGFIATSGAGTVAKTGAEGNWNNVDGISGFGPIVGNGEGIVDGGVTVHAVGSNANQNIIADAFFDSNKAGLGVCSSLSCKSGVGGAVTSDDNLNTDVESLILNFTSLIADYVKITDLLVRNGGHGLANGDFMINGDTYTLTSGKMTANALDALAASGSFTFNYISDGPELYISTVTVAAIPVPATGLLLMSALAGGAAFGRRRKAKA